MDSEKRDVLASLELNNVPNFMPQRNLTQLCALWAIKLPSRKNRDAILRKFAVMLFFSSLP
jgi:hypothetical protein